MTASDPPPTTTRRILALALPALGSLVAQPLFVLTDTVMVGHLGESALGGLAIGSSVITTAVGLLVFLAYTTTPLVARRLGAGDRPGAIRAGIDGMWLAAGLGVALMLIGLFASRPIVDVLAADRAVADAALAYLAPSLWGLPGMLVSIAATGLMRGLQDTVTPLRIAIVGAVVNVLLNFVLIFPAGLGIAGSAFGTAITETLMAAAYVVLAVRAARAAGVSLHPGIGDPRGALLSSFFLFLRTVTLRASLLLLVWAAGMLGVSELAALQVTMTVFNVLAFALDALAIAAQAMIGHDLGAGSTDAVRRLVRTLCWWGAAAGAVIGVVLGAVAGPLAGLLVADAALVAPIAAGFVTIAALLPLSGLVFVLDGVLIGANDGRYLALAGLAPLAVLAGGVQWLLAVGPTGTDALVGIWLAWAGALMLARAAVLVGRVRGRAWLGR